MYSDVSVILPAKNESASLRDLLPALSKTLPGAEILVVDDGSTDDTAEIAEQSGCTVIRHPYSMGNGAAVKSGARKASTDIIVFMDADGQHAPEDVPRLVEGVADGHDMVVGARSRDSQANSGRAVANRIYNWLASKIVGHRIEDLTSGFRAVRRERFLEFLSILPNGFSYPTTITMCFFRAGYGVSYRLIYASKRIGASHIKPLRDGARFFLVIFRVATLYSPLKLFVPVAFAIFAVGVLYYGYTYLFFNRFTNMSALLFSTAVIVFMMGLISEQITFLIYKKDK